MQGQSILNIQVQACRQKISWQQAQQWRNGKNSKNPQYCGLTYVLAQAVKLRYEEQQTKLEI